MSIADSVSQIFLSLQIIKESIDATAWNDTPLPIIVSPQWWIDEVAKQAALAGDIAPDVVPAGFEIHGCSVLLNEHAEEPLMITHDGKVYTVLPDWQRKDRGLVSAPVAPAPVEVVS